MQYPVLSTDVTTTYIIPITTGLCHFLLTVLKQLKLVIKFPVIGLSTETLCKALV